MSRPQRQLKPQTPSLDRATPSHEGAIGSTRTFDLGEAHYELKPVQTDNQLSLRAPSVWHDLLVTLVLGAAVIGILAYFLGWLVAIAIVAAVIVALALCVNFAINNTIDLRS